MFIDESSFIVRPIDLREGVRGREETRFRASNPIPNFKFNYVPLSILEDF